MEVFNKSLESIEWSLLKAQETQIIRKLFCWLCVFLRSYKKRFI